VRANLNRHFFAVFWVLVQVAALKNSRKTFAVVWKALVFTKAREHEKRVLTNVGQVKYGR